MSEKMTGREKALGAAWVACVAVGVMFPTFEAHAAESEDAMTYDEAVNECSWIAAADNVPCEVLPNGDGWQAREVPIFEDGSYRYTDGTTGCIPGELCDLGVDESAIPQEQAEPAVPVTGSPTFTG